MSILVIEWPSRHSTATAADPCSAYLLFFSKAKLLNTKPMFSEHESPSSGLISLADEGGSSNEDGTSILTTDLNDLSLDQVW